MSHPGPLLTDLADGTLSAAQRAEVEAHLAGCARCRQEAALAAAARASLRSLPPATAPAGLAEAAIAEASAQPAPTRIADARSKRPNPRWIAAAAVAAMIGLLAIASPKLGSSPSQTAAAGAGGAADRSFAKAAAVEVVGANLSSQQLALAAAALGGAQPAPEAAPGTSGAAPTADSSYAAAVSLPDLQPRQLLPERLPKASACLEQAWGAAPGELTRVVLARFEGTPAYFGLYAVGPGAGLPPTRLQLLVASIADCQPLASAYAML